MLQIHPDREIKLVVTPGGRVGYVKVRDPKGKRITVRYIDARDEQDEVTVDESLPGLRFVVLRAREVFRKEAGAGRYALNGASAKAARTPGTRGAGGKTSAPSRGSRGTGRSARA